MKNKPQNRFVDGAWLFAVRRALGVSRRELGEKLHVTERAIQYWEDNERSMPASIVMVLDTLLDHHKTVIEKLAKKYDLS